MGLKLLQDSSLAYWYISGMNSAGWTACILAAFCYLAAGVPKMNKDFAGPYELVVKRPGDCENRGTNQVVIESNKISKYNRTTFLYSTNITFAYDMDDNTEVNIAASVYSNGRWANNFLNKNFGGFCTALRTYLPQYAKKIFKKLGYSTCPIKAGTYEVKDLDLVVNLNWPYIPYGRYKAEFPFTDTKGKRVGCKAFYVDVVPKETN